MRIDSLGTGKSVLLREIIKSLKRKYSSAPDVVAVVASTGMAACNIGGTTIHSWSGIGIGVESAEALIAAVKKKRESAGRWIRAKVLVIDEGESSIQRIIHLNDPGNAVSMVDAFLFDKLAAIAAALKKNSLPFGGIQVRPSATTLDTVLTPRAAHRHRRLLPAPTRHQGRERNIRIRGDVVEEVHRPHRQLDSGVPPEGYWYVPVDRARLRGTDKRVVVEFIDMLNEMRFGTLTPASIAKFKELKRDPCYQDGIDPTELYVALPSYRPSR
jgi:ATP-dependent DNA helicase PIF1